MTPPRQTPAHRHVPARARAVVIALALGIVAALAMAERADAGDYVVTQCSSVTPFVQASWERSSEHYRQRALCGTDGGLQVFHDAETTQLGGVRRLGLARPERDRVHRRPGEREPHQPGRPPR